MVRTVPEIILSQSTPINTHGKNSYKSVMDIDDPSELKATHDVLGSVILAILLYV